MVQGRGAESDQDILTTGEAAALCGVSRSTLRRAVAQGHLQAWHTPGKHLVMVRYEQDHNIHDEWVYNGADIDGAKVLWARELDAQQNAKLFAYFKDRQIWLVTPDSDNEYLEPYRPPGVELVDQ